MHTEADDEKGVSNALSCVLTCLDALWRPTPLPNNQNLTTKVTTTDTIIIRIELNAICCNYGVQKNRNNLLRCGFMLTLLRHFQPANALFLVKGHANNYCDRTFNVMKQNYHEHQAWAC